MWIGICSASSRAPIGAAVQSLPLRIVDNDEYEKGIASSIRAGVRAIAAEVSSGLLLGMTTARKLFYDAS
ncbi:MAG: hypothetical protein ACREV1_10370 [Gammaproteobacteria bacterium]